MVLDFDLYGIADAEVAGGRSIVVLVQEMIAGGIRIIQFRAKELGDEEFRRLAIELRQITKEKGVIFIVNDRLEIAKEVDADGVHLGQDDLAGIGGPAKVGNEYCLPHRPAGGQTRSSAGARKGYKAEGIKKFLGEGKIVGISTHSLEQAIEAEKSGADYIGIGPVFKTSTKPELEPIGLEVVREVVKSVKIPVVAIGGLKEENLDEVLKTGLLKVAMISEICRAENAAEKVRRLREKILNFKK